MNRFKIKLMFLVAISGSSFAQAADVVKILNFSCPVCRASENLDESITQVLAEHGGKFVAAPVPSDETSGSKERAYYASRLQGDAVANVVKRSLFKGSQDLQYPLDDLAQTVAWLEDDLTNGTVKVNFSQLAQDSASEEASQALYRAARVAVRAGAQALPTYVVLKNNQIVGSFDPQSVGTNSLIALRDAVIKAVQQADSKN